MKKKKLIGISVFCLAAAVMLFIGGIKYFSPEKQSTDSYPDPVAEPSDQKEAEKTVIRLLEKASSGGDIRIETEALVELRDIDTDSESLTEILKFAKNSYNDRMSRAYDTRDVDYGGDTSFIKNALPDSPIKGFETGKKGDTLEITLIYPSFEGTDFENADRNMAVKAVEENKSSYLVKDSEVKKHDVKYTAFINRITGSCTGLSIKRTYDASLTMAFRGDLEALGEKKVSFTGDIKTDFNIYKAGISFTESELYMRKNTRASLPYVLNVSGDDYKVSFSSSDPEAVRVNENGTVRVLKKSSEAVEITAQLEFNEKTFTSKMKIYTEKSE